jgi:hypothetical protein
MGMPLPADLVPLLTAAGGDWPDADEDALQASAEQWHGVAGLLRERSVEVDSAIRLLRDRTAHPDSLAVAGPSHQLADGALAAEAIALALASTAAVVLELKAVTLAELGMLAARLAAPAAGEALAERAAATAVTGVALRRARTRAAEIVDGTVVRVLGAAETRLRAAQASPPRRP